jgi:hypothetical protein
MGDWNSVVGGKSYQNIVGPHGLVRRNQRGQMHIDICERNGLVITNIWFKKPKRSKSTLVGLRTCETLIQKQYEGCADNAWSKY